MTRHSYPFNAGIGMYVQQSQYINGNITTVSLYRSSIIVVIIARWTCTATPIQHHRVLGIIFIPMDIYTTYADSIPSYYIITMCTELDMLVFGYVTVIHIHPLSGVSSFCKIPDSDGNTLEVSIGIYSSMPSEFKDSYDHASDDNIELFRCTISVQSELHWLEWNWEWSARNYSMPHSVLSTYQCHLNERQNSCWGRQNRTGDDTKQ